LFNVVSPNSLRNRFGVSLGAGRENGSRGALGQHCGAHFGRKLIDVFRVPEVSLTRIRARYPNKTTATNAIIGMRTAISQEKT